MKVDDVGGYLVIRTERWAAISVEGSKGRSVPSLGKQRGRFVMPVRTKCEKKRVGERGRKGWMISACPACQDAQFSTSRRCDSLSFFWVPFYLLSHRRSIFLLGYEIVIIIEHPRAKKVLRMTDPVVVCLVR